MRIVIDARLYGLENAGLGRYVVNLVRNLSLSDRKNEYILLLRRKYFDQLVLPQNWKKVLADFKHYGFYEQFFLPIIIRNQKADLVHFPHFNVPIFYKGKFVVTIHDLLMHRQKGLNSTTLIAPVYFFKRFMYRLVFNYAVNYSKFIIVPSNSVKKELCYEYKINPSKIAVTYEGIDVRVVGPNNFGKFAPYFVYAGNAYPHKNLIRLVQAVKALNTKVNHKVNLIIASSRNIFTHRIEKIISDLDAKNFVKIIGFVKDDELGNLFKNSAAFVFASLSEGFGLPGLEALSVGTILLASDIPTFREVYGDCAIYFNPLDTYSIEDAMRGVLALKNTERNRKIREAQVFIRKYSWKKMASETLTVYQETTSK